jgi:hypothetical protein
VSNSTQAQAAVGQHASASVIPLFTEVVVDDGAIQAERLALLAELGAEQFHNAGPTQSESGRRRWLLAARHMKCAAHLARMVADRERARCAAIHGCPCNDRVLSDPIGESA